MRWCVLNVVSTSYMYWKIVSSIVKKNCVFCGTDRDPMVLFLDFDTGNNSPDNMLNVCRHCYDQYKILRARNAVETLKELGYVNDKRGRWIWGNKLVRKELEDVEALR